MSQTKYQADCPGCQPVLLDQKTGQLFADESTQMQKVRQIFSTLTQQDLDAYHRVCCRNSREAEDMRRTLAIAERVRTALAS